MIRFQIVQGLLQIGWQDADAKCLALRCGEMIDVQIYRFSRIDAPLNSIEARCQDHGEGQVGVAGGSGDRNSIRVELFPRPAGILIREDLLGPDQVM